MTHFKKPPLNYWIGLVFFSISTLEGYLMPNPVYTYVLVCFGWVLWHINHCRLFNAKSSSYIHILVSFGRVYGISTIVGYLMLNPVHTYIYWVLLVGFYGISTIVGYLMLNPVHTYIYWFLLVGFYGISTIVCYLMPNLYIHRLVWFGLVLK